MVSRRARSASVGRMPGGVEVDGRPCGRRDRRDRQYSFTLRAELGKADAQEPGHDQPHSCPLHSTPLGRRHMRLAPSMLGRPGRWRACRSTPCPTSPTSKCRSTRSAPALSPAEIEKQVTLRIETALAGIPGLDSTRSLSRNGFSQITAVFAETTDIYFARQQVDERLLELRAEPAAGRRSAMGPISTGLGEIYMWAVSSPAQGGRRHTGLAAMAASTPEGERLVNDVQRGPICARCRTGLSGPRSRASPAWPASIRSAAIVKQYQVQPDPSKLVALRSFVRRPGRGDRSQQRQPRRQLHRAQRRRYVVRTGGRLETSRISARSLSAPAAAFPSASAMSPAWRSAAKCGPAAPARTAMRWSSAPP